MSYKAIPSQSKDQLLVLKPFLWALVIGPLILLLLFPIIQWKYKVVPEIHLAGVEATVAERPVFKYSDWLTGEYQKKVELAFSTSNGLRGFFVRLDNQINFSLFQECRSYNGGIAVGKDNWLFEKTYINEMNNDSKVDLSVLEPRIIKMRKLQDMLASQGIYFIFIITPSKATVYGEYLSKKHIKNLLIRETAKYTTTRLLLDTHGINYMDAHKFFMDNKETAPYDLFVRSGTHWSYYGASLFSMALVSRIKGDTRLPIGSIYCESIEVSSLPWSTDADLAYLMNVFDMTPTCRDMAHPVMKTSFPPNAIRPDVLVVGGSFLCTINELVCDKLFGKRDFYYYNLRNIPKPFSKDRESIPKNGQLKDSILNKQIIIVESNEAALNNIGSGFIENAIVAIDPDHGINLLDRNNFLTKTQVSQLYVSIFGRASEGRGNAYWRTNQTDMATAADTMLATRAAKKFFGPTLNSNQMFIELIYKDVLSKTYTDDPDGINYWVKKLTNGESKGQVVASIINAVMASEHKGSPAQNRFINKVTVSNYTADKIEFNPEKNDISPLAEWISGISEDTATVVSAKAAVDALANL